MSKIEITPGMFSKVEAKPSFKTPITLAVAALIVFVFFGLLGKAGDVVFVWSDKRELIQLPQWSVASAGLGIAVGVILLLIAGLSIFLASKEKKTPI
jgi:hypothetical protein